MRKGLYLCSRKHRLLGYDILYNDIIPYDGIDIVADCYTIDADFLRNFDYIIATPPCNYYSRANYRRETSYVAQITKDLLPHCLDICKRAGKPFIIENVQNSTLLPKDDELYRFDYGGHTFYTNVFMFVPSKSYAVRQNKQHVSHNKRDGNFNVDIVIKYFLYSLEMFVYNDIAS